MTDETMARIRVGVRRSGTHLMRRLIMRDENDAVTGVMAGVHAVGNPNQGQHYDKRGGNVRTALA